MIEFRFLKSTDATPLTTGAMVKAANPDLVGQETDDNIRALTPKRPVGSNPTQSKPLHDLDSIVRHGKSTSETEIRARIDQCQREHRELDNRIDALVGQRDANELKIRRLKKSKLQLKDMIVALEMLLVPDIPA